MRFKRMIVALTLVGALAALAATAALGASTDVGQPTFAYSRYVTTVTDKSVAVSNITKRNEIVLRWEKPNGLSRAERNSLGGCYNLKVGTSFVNSGIDKAGKRYYFPAHVKKGDTLFCGQGAQRFKASCGNHTPTTPVPLVAKKVRLVRTFTFTATVRVRAAMSVSGTVYAECRSGGAYAYARASGYGYAVSEARATVKGKTKMDALSRSTSAAMLKLESETAVRQKAEASARAYLNLVAQATCSGSTLPPPPQAPPGADVPQPPPPPQVCPPNTTGTYPNCTPSKDGTQGPGTNVPGQPGGSGAGGSAGAGSGPTCRDSSGNLVPGTPNSQGNCPGVSSGGTTGGSTPAGPTPPPTEKCLDPATGQQRDMKSGESKDQFGYCYKP